MRYIDVRWIHDYEEEPIRLVSEIGPDNFERRKLEFFRNGKVGVASKSIEVAGTRVGIVEVPSIEEITSQQEFEGCEINKNEFELLWQKYLPSSS
ncbi:DUF6881 domain-containing protein [Idiomarina sp.]|uniref:DUF6881 domain-containing protein n=1 Tax=Idiomarina sp. TaxID=1874361 RepID=UPI003A91ABB0